MKIAIPIYEGFTALDAIGPYEVLRSVPGWEVEFVAKSRGEVRTDSGAVGLSADRGLAEVGEPDVLLVPGGMGTRRVMEEGIEYDPDPPFDAGSPDKAPAQIVELVSGISRAE